MEKMNVVRNYMSFVILGVALLYSGSIVPPEAEAGESNVYLAVDSFTWKEFGDDGSRLLKESGTLFGVGFTYMKEFNNHVTLKPTAEIFGGTVDYDGHTQSGIPATSTVDYFGVKLEGELGRRYRSTQSFFVEPFGGLGFRAWLRDINNGTTATGSTAYGYTEDWITLHARLGVRGGVDFSRASQFFAEAGVKLPLYNENTLSDGSDVTLKPGKQASLFAETGIKIKRFKGSLFYDSLRFSKSPIVASGAFLYWQPKSTMDMYGIKLGLVF
jgi:hypothetical protein